MVTALEGPVAVTVCNEPGEARCDRKASCPLRDNWERVNDAIRGALSDLTLAQMVGTLPTAWRNPSQERP